MRMKINQMPKQTTLTLYDIIRLAERKNGIAGSVHDYTVTLINDKNESIEMKYPCYIHVIQKSKEK